jgi:hypothetical protein
MESTNAGHIIGTFLRAAIAKIDSLSLICFPISFKSSAAEIRFLFSSGMPSTVLNSHFSKL